MILLVVTLLCTSHPTKPAKVVHRPSQEQTFKQRWLAGHFRDLAK